MSETTSRIMTLPTLALRGVSVFPGTMLHFDVERPISIAALNAAIGTDRMISALNENPGADPEHLLLNVRKAVDSFVKEAEQFDDLTMLCIRYNGPAPQIP